MNAIPEPIHPVRMAEQEAPNQVTAVARLTERVRAICIENAEDANRAADLTREIKGYAAVLDGREKEITRPLNASLASIRALFKPARDGLIAAEAAIKTKISDWNIAEEKRRREVQRKLDEAAERERAKLRQEAAAAEARARERAEALREQARSLQDEAARAALEARAQTTLETAQARAEAKAELAATIVAPVIPDAPKPAGISTQMRWKGDVTDLAALVTAIAHGQAPAHLVRPDPAAIDRYARGVRDTVTIPGLAISAVPVIAVRH